MFSHFETVLTEIFARRVEPANLTVDAERELILAAKGGDDDAKLALMRAYAPLLQKAEGVASSTSAYAPQNADVEDVRMYAVLGLLEAIEAFDPEVHHRLAAVASDYVNRQISAASKTAATAFRVPDRTLERFFAIMREAEGNVYDAARLAPEYAMKRETFFSILSAVREVDSYDAPVGSDEEGAYLASLEATSVYGRVRSDNEIVEDTILVETAFGAVDDLEEDVVRLAYGFSDYNPVSDAEIAERMGYSRPKVQRTRSGALGKMRSALGVA